MTPTNRETTPPTRTSDDDYADAMFRRACDATPSSAAQDDPAKGLEAVAWRWRAGLWGPDDWRLTDEKPDLGGYNCKTTMQALTDHATAERQIAELRSRVAELEGRCVPRTEIAESWEERALEAEAAVAKREARVAELKRDYKKLQRLLNKTDGEKSDWISAYERRDLEINAAEARALAAEAENKGLRDIVEGERDHWLKAAQKHHRSGGRRSDHQAADLERARIASRILEKIDARQALAAKEAGE